MGTLGVSRYLRVVASVQRLVERAGKKAYTLVVGKLNPAKLANFAEARAFCIQLFSPLILFFNSR